MAEPSATIHHSIQQIHDHPAKLVLEFAGAGSLALFWLHSVAGSSRTILEATDRYASSSMEDLLGALPEKFVSQATAEAMARQAYRRARRLAGAETPCLGVGCTATIATDRAKRGDHGVWVAVYDRQGVRSYGLTLTKGARDRLGEEAVVGQLLVRAVAAACQLDPAPVDLLAGEQIEPHATPDPDQLALLLDGAVETVTVYADGRRVAGESVQGGLLSGSFNPLHMGHERLAEASAAAIGQPVRFELPVVNADKPPLTVAEIERRLPQFRWRYDVVLSRAPLFVQKAALFPGCVFVLGFDTAARLLDPRYYSPLTSPEQAEAARDAALAQIQAHGCRFLVAGRAVNGEFHTLDDLDLPPAYAQLFSALPESAFRIDLSSTAIRAQLAAAQQ